MPIARERGAALDEVSKDPTERREQHELAVDETREPLARDLAARVRRAASRGLRIRGTGTRGAAGAP